MFIFIIRLILAIYEQVNIPKLAFPTLIYLSNIDLSLSTVGGNKEELVDAAKRQMEQFYDDIVSREGNRPFRFKVGHKRSEEDEFVLIVTKEYNE